MEAERKHGQVQWVDGNYPRGFQVGASRWQVRLNDIHQRLNVEDRLLYILSVRELKGDDGKPVLRRRTDVAQTFDVDELFFDRLADIELHFLGGQSRHHGNDAHDRALHIRSEAAGHGARHGEPRQQQYADVKGDHDVGVFNRPAGNVVNPRCSPQRVSGARGRL